MKEVDPKTRTFELTNEDFRQAVIEYARKGKRGLSDEDVVVKLRPNQDRTEIMGGIVTFKIKNEAEQPAPTG